MPERPIKAVYKESPPDYTLPEFWHLGKLFEEKYTTAQLYIIHSALTADYMRNHHRRWETRKFEEHPAGSFVISYVHYEDAREACASDGSEVYIPAGGQFIEIHFAPFGYTDDSVSRRIKVETLLLIAIDAPKMLKQVRQLTEDHPKLKHIFGCTNFGMSEIAIRFGFHKSEPISTSWLPKTVLSWKGKKDEYTYDVFTDDIHQFLKTAGGEIGEITQRSRALADKLHIDEKRARIDAILSLMGNMPHL
jgi:hypothetical protein